VSLDLEGIVEEEDIGVLLVDNGAQGQAKEV